MSSSISFGPDGLARPLLAGGWLPLEPVCAAPRCDHRPAYRPTSVGIRPKSELLLANRPQAGEAMRLLDQQIADQRAENDEFEVGYRVGVQGDPERGRHLIEKNRQQQDEAG